MHLLEHLLQVAFGVPVDHILFGGKVELKKNRINLRVVLFIGGFVTEMTFEPFPAAVSLKGLETV